MFSARIVEYVGIDPDLPQAFREDGFNLVAGKFPDDLPSEKPFDVITMLAVLEHLPEHSLGEVTLACARYLKFNGTLILTIPSSSTDRLLRLLTRLKIIDGMSLEDHYGFDIHQVPKIFNLDEFEFVHHKCFQLGFNNLFIFRKE